MIRFIQRASRIAVQWIMGQEHRRMGRERRTIAAMVRIYCRGHHGLPGGDLCADCGEMLDYAHARLRACRYQEHKPTCGNCPRHCYKPSMKERVVWVMGYAGPRMTFRHPLMALMHLIDGFRPVPPGGKGDGRKAGSEPHP